MLLLPIVFLCLPSSYFDNGQSICIFVLLLDKQCPGCGMTRAIQHLIHLEFSQAWNFNHLSFVVFFVILYYWIKEMVKLKTQIKLFNSQYEGDKKQSDLLKKITLESNRYLFNDIFIYLIHRNLNNQLFLYNTCSQFIIVENFYKRE